MRFLIPLLLIVMSICSASGADPIPEQENLSSPRLALIDARGTLVVGVKVDYPPWGFYDDSGNIIGLEADLAQDIANRLGVALELQAVTTSNRIDKLEQGAIDVLIATMGDTLQRRKQTGILEPNYYSSGVTLLVPKETTIQSWAELYGQSVCLTKNTYFNRVLVERFLLKPKEFKGTLDNLAALRIGKCKAWIYDDTALARLLQDKQWENFKTPLPSIMINPWAIAVKQSERTSDFGYFISDLIIDWHRSGRLLELELKWGIRESQFLMDYHQRWKEKDEQGNYICQRQADKSILIDCLGRKSVAASIAIQDNILSQWGIDFPPAYDPYSAHSLIKGIFLTLILSVMAILGSLLFGLLAGIGLYRLPPVLSWCASRINDIFRMTPPLLNLYILFFGLGGLVALHYGIQFNAVLVAIIVFSLYAGSSNAVLLCHALQEQSKRHVKTSTGELFKSAFQNAYEGINANSINIVKAVGMASTIAVPELISSSNSIIAEFGSKAEMMTFLLVFYFIIVFSFIFLLDQLKKLIVKSKGVEHE